MSDDSTSRDQSAPIEDGSDDASDKDRIEGILEQTRADVAQGHVDNVRDALAQRLGDAGMEVSRDEFEELLARVTA
ncbi:MAG: hypothetical protein JWP85_525 [Rhodoglobus sp.]|nr:hypothetical protein [Rhodoglobus sp.]